ncbi:MAG: mevalonate kinase [Armatimonadetes bacterium]|nr:mevalonate kinase [Armatimonadota bacterium]
MGKGSGFGKVIIFGEHFIIYGVPGIVSAIDLTTDATVNRRNDERLLIDDRRVGTPGYIESKLDQQIESIERMGRMAGIDGVGLDISLDGGLPVFSGLGASGASCVAIARAISEEFCLGLADAQINDLAHEGERAYHGEKTAGLDNLAATYGGLLRFEKGRPEDFERLMIEEPVEVVIGNTGIVANSKAVIDGVAERRKSRHAEYDILTEQAKSVAEEGLKALLAGDLADVGSLMNENHNLLQAIGVSCPELDHLVGLAKKEGALGAKQTGSGGGGCMLALTPGQELQERVASAMEKEGFAVLRARIGGTR